ncbi:MAG: HRDC domain-containing protein [Bacteroidales bacterium]|nr:HRDC domain-containing protein [Bacteroidales bacterium]
MAPFDLAEQYINSTRMSVFMTGKAGTGKTTFLRHIVETTHKRCVVLAPTGVAAINAGGVTIHSFFMLPLCPYLPDVKELVTEYQLPDKSKHFRKEKIRLIRMLDLIIIDEISMVRADLLDAVDATLRRIRRTNKPFGGIQLLMIGDLLQLPPVVTDEERPYMERVYPSPFFFHSKALKSLPYVTIELKTIFRQHDETFIRLLNNIRENRYDDSTLQALNAHYNPAFDPSDNEGYIRLTTHNYQADSINDKKLKALKSRGVDLQAHITGNFPATSYPTAEKLTLKKGAQVMFIKNASDGAWYNGKIATVEGYDKEQGVAVVDREGNHLVVRRERWENIKYEASDNENVVKEVVEGTFDQYPLRLAWAITIHKSQGLTFDKVIIDAANAFTFGQVYVALSRCRSLDGLVLSSPITRSGAIDNSDLLEFNDSLPPQEQIEDQLNQCQRTYYFETLFELFNVSTLQRAAEEVNSDYQSHLRRLYPKGAAKMSALCTGPIADLADVAERFHRQLQHIVEQCGGNPDDAKLQERIAKGQAYFSQQLEEIFLTAAPLMEVEVENKAVATDLAQHTEALRDAIGLMQRCLARVGKEGFSTEVYNQAKADFLFEKERDTKTPTASKKKKSTASKKPKVSTTDDVMHPELVARLSRWRHLEADKIGKPAYVVLSQKTLYNIANLLPRNMNELQEVYGIGPAKCEQYGDKILAIVGKYLRELKK